MVRHLIRIVLVSGAGAIFFVSGWAFLWLASFGTSLAIEYWRWPEGLTSLILPVISWSAFAVCAYGVLVAVLELFRSIYRIFRGQASIWWW